MNELDALDHTLACARSGLSPSDAQLERIGARLAALPLPQLEPPAFATPAVGHWAALRATGGAGLAVAGLLIAGGFVAGYLAHRTLARTDLEPPSRTPIAVAAPEIAPPAPAAPPAAIPSTAPPSAEPRAGQAVAPRPRPSHSPTDDTAAELALLERIDRALRGSDGALALALLRELDARHPRTRLAEERSAARVMADCLVGKRNARASARSFLEAHTASVYASRLRALCGLDRDPDGSNGSLEPGHSR